MFVDIEVFYKQVACLLKQKFPNEVLVSASVYPLTYEGYNELWVETKSKSRYRCLCSDVRSISEFQKVEYPGEVKNGK